MQHQQPSTHHEIADDINEEQANYAMLMHFAQFAALVIPLIGWLAPILMWLLRKDEPFIDQHGKFIANWMVSLTLFGIGGLILLWWLPLLLIPLLVLLGIASMIMTVMSAINAKQCELRPYPLTIDFFK